MPSQPPESSPSTQALVVLLSHSVVSDSLWPHGLQHTRLPCPLLSPGVCLNSSPLGRWCHPTMSSRHPLLLLPLIFPSIRVFFSSSHQVAKVSALQHQSFQLFGFIQMCPHYWYSSVTCFLCCFCSVLALCNLSSLIQGDWFVMHYIMAVYYNGHYFQLLLVLHWATYIELL